MLTILVKGRQCVAVDDFLAIAKDNETEHITFVFEEMPMQGIVSIKTKLKNVEDKILLEKSADAANTYIWTVKSKTIPVTGYIDCQLEITHEGKIWQTEYFTMRVERTIDVNKTIEDEYPTILIQIMEKLENLPGGGGSGTSFTTDETLTLKNGILGVNTAKAVEADNTLPITSAAVHTTVGNIEVLLQTI